MNSLRPRTCGGAITGRLMLNPTASHSGPCRAISRRPLRSSAQPHMKLRGSSSIRRVPKVRCSIAWNALAADQRVAGDGVVAQRPAPHPLLEADRVDLVGVAAHREQRADTAPMLTPATRSIVTPAAVSSSSTPMCENARAPPPDSTIPTECRPAGGPCGPMSASNSASRTRATRPARARPPSRRARRARRRRRPGRSPAARDDGQAPAGPVRRGHGQDPVGLLEAELRPGLAAGRAADEQNQVVAGLGPVEQWPVHGWLVHRAPLRPVPPQRRAPRPTGERRARRPAGRRAARSGIRRRARPARPSSAAAARSLAGARVSRSCSASDRLSASDSAGELCRSSVEVGLVDGDELGGARGAHRRRARRIGQQRELAERVTAAVARGSPAPAPSSTTSRRPARTTYIASPGRPRGTAISLRPGGARRDVAASRSTSSGSRPENSGVRAEELAPPTPRRGRRLRAGRSAPSTRTRTRRARDARRRGQIPASQAARLVQHRVPQHRLVRPRLAPAPRRP